jgi:hypothetical protein
MKNTVFRDVMPYGTCKNRRFGGTYHHDHHGEKNQTARNSVSSNEQISTLMMKAIRSSETSILTRAKRRNISEDAILLRILKPIILPVALYECRTSSFDIEVGTQTEGV